MGIEQSDISKLFQPYAKIMGNRELNREGCGLGLTISKNLANALGGSIEVESEVNKGSIFTLSLPLQRRDEENNYKFRSDLYLKQNSRIKT